MAVQNLYNPAVAPDTKGLSSGITAAGQALAGGLEQYANTRAAAKAADAEYDLFQQMYPGAAAMIDSEKFHSANLAGKQKMLGMGKGYVLEQLEKEKAGQEMSLKQLEMNLRREDMGLRREEMQQRMAIAAGQLELSAQELAQRGIEAGNKDAYYDKQLSLDERKLAEEVARRSVGARKFTTPDGRYNFYTDANGNRISGLPMTENVKGPFAGGLSSEVPVAVMKAAGKSASRIQTIEDPITKELLERDPKTGTWAPLRKAGSAAASVDPLNKYLGTAN